MSCCLNCFRNKSGEEWFYYNDTQDSVMQVRVTFGITSLIIPLGKTKLEHRKSDIVATLTIMPLETEGFIKGKPNGYKSNVVSNTFTQIQKEEYKTNARKRVQIEMKKVAEVQKKKNDNTTVIMKFKDEDKVLGYCIKKKNVPYVDLNFPPINTSLKKLGDTSNTSNIFQDLDKFAWRRPQDYLPNSWQNKIALYRKGVNPRAIDQGELGDCWFLCSLSALAESSKTIKSLFINPHWCCRRRKEEKAGAYHVTLNINGLWNTMIVDNYLPSTSKLPCFARTRNAPCDLWVSLIEKSYAKAYGSYASIVGGSPSHALQDLTGFPTFYFKTNIEEVQDRLPTILNLFKKLHEWKRNKYLITVDTPSSDIRTSLINRRVKNINVNKTEELFKKAGLALGHAYTVLDIKNFPIHGLCMLKIRNPWANHVEWSGDWSDNSELWKKYPIIKAICRPKKKDDGIFWMEWKDVAQFFEDGSVCFYRPGYYEYRFSGFFNLEIPNLCLEVIVKKKFKVWVMLIQKDKRGLASLDPDSEYTSLLINISGSSGNEQKIQWCSSDNPEESSDKYLFVKGKSVSLLHEFKPENSPYFIIPRRMMGNKDVNKCKSFVLALLSKKKISKSLAEINFKDLNKDCNVFKNFTSFNPKTASSITNTFQYKNGENLPVMKEGSSVHKAKKVSNSK